MPKRSLMLAGGGVKIAFQAGVLQVWLDEAGIAFDHAVGLFYFGRLWDVYARRLLSSAPF
jgi:hypothetical protein